MGDAVQGVQVLAAGPFGIAGVVPRLRMPIPTFMRGRVWFLDPRGKGQPTPFSLMLLTLGANGEQKARYAQLVPGFWLARSLAPAAVAGD